MWIVEKRGEGTRVKGQGSRVKGQGLIALSTSELQNLRTFLTFRTSELQNLKTKGEGDKSNNPHRNLI